MSYSTSINTIDIDSIDEHDYKEPVDHLHYKGFTDFLESLLEMDVLEAPAKGISKQILDKGLDSLSGPQKKVIQKQVLDVYSRAECPDCNHEFSWDEMYWVVMDGCPQCEYNRERMLEA